MQHNMTLSRACGCLKGRIRADFENFLTVKRFCELHQFCHLSGMHHCVFDSLVSPNLIQLAQIGRISLVSDRTFSTTALAPSADLSEACAHRIFPIVDWRRFNLS